MGMCGVQGTEKCVREVFVWVGGKLWGEGERSKAGEGRECLRLRGARKG